MVEYIIRDMGKFGFQGILVVDGNVVYESNNGVNFFATELGCLIKLKELAEKNKGDMKNE